MGNQPSGGATAGLDCNVNCPGKPGNDPNQNEILVGCGPMGSVGNYAECPSDEWEKVGESDNTCTYATGREGCFMECRPGSACNGSGNCSSVGRQLRCRRKNGGAGYTADKTQCCLRNADSIDGKSCDPTYRDKKSAACQTALADYCKKGLNLFSNECKAWALGDGNGNPEADSIMSEVCMRGENTNRAQCKCIVLANQLAKQGLSSKVPIGCAGTGACAGTDVFKTTEMRRRNCVQVDCTVKDIELLKSKVNNVNIQQICTANPDTNLGSRSNISDKGKSSYSGSGAQSIDTGGSSTTKTILIVGGVIGGIALIGGIAYALSRPRRPRFPSTPPMAGYANPAAQSPQPYPMQMPPQQMPQQYPMQMPSQQMPPQMPPQSQFMGMSQPSSPGYYYN